MSLLLQAKYGEKGLPWSLSSMWLACYPGLWSRTGDIQDISSVKREPFFSLALFTTNPPHAVASCSMSEFERAIKTASSRSLYLAGSLESLYKLLCCLGVSSGKVSELPAGGLHKGQNHKEMKDITISSTDWQILLQKNSAAVYSSVSVQGRKEELYCCHSKAPFKQTEFRQETLWSG